MRISQKYILSWIVFCAVAIAANAQDFQLRSIFRPRLTIGYEDMPSMALNDSVSFRNNEYSFGATLPLRVKVQIKKLQPRLKMDFLLLNGGFRKSFFQGLEPDHGLLRASVGVSGLRAKLNSGVWFYTLNAGVSADLTEPDQNFPYFAGAFGKIFIKGVKKQNLFGAGLFLGRGVALPFPVIGFNRLYSLNNGLIALVPMYVKYWHSLSPGITFSGKFSLGGFNNAWTPQAGSRLPTTNANPVTLRITHARLGAQFEFKILRQIILYVDGGMDLLKNIRFSQEDNSIYRELLPFQPYARTGITWKIPRKDTKWFIPEF